MFWLVSDKIHIGCPLLIYIFFVIVIELQAFIDFLLRFSVSHKVQQAFTPLSKQTVPETIQFQLDWCFKEHWYTPLPMCPLFTED